MYESFQALSEEKQQRIIDVCIQEFAQYGYENSSTNRIIKESGISKGSLFKYFHTKEDMYLYILDYVVNEITSEIRNKTDNLPQDIFDRVYRVAEIEMDLHLRKPVIYSLFKKAFSADTELAQKLFSKYKEEANIFFDLLFDQVDDDNLRYDKMKTIEVLKWVLTGLNEKVFQMRDQEMEDIEELHQGYFEQLSTYLEMLKMGLEK